MEKNSDSQWAGATLYICVTLSLAKGLFLHLYDHEGIQPHDTNEYIASATSCWALETRGRNAVQLGNLSSPDKMWAGSS
jgi:hypothetical protein